MVKASFLLTTFANSWFSPFEKREKEPSPCDWQAVFGWTKWNQSLHALMSKNLTISKQWCLLQNKMKPAIQVIAECSKWKSNNQKVLLLIACDTKSFLCTFQNWHVVVRAWCFHSLIHTAQSNVGFANVRILCFKPSVLVQKCKMHKPWIQLIQQLKWQIWWHLNIFCSCLGGGHLDLECWSSVQLADGDEFQMNKHKIAQPHFWPITKLQSVLVTCTRVTAPKSLLSHHPLFVSQIQTVENINQRKNFEVIPWLGALLHPTTTTSGGRQEARDKHHFSDLNVLHGPCSPTQLPTSTPFLEHRSLTTWKFDF